MIWLQSLVYLALAVTVVSMTWYGLTFAPYVPSGAADVIRGLRLAGLRPGERLVDTGSGDGRVVRLAAGTFGAQATGLEGDWALFLWSSLRQRLRPLAGVHFRHGNFFAQPLPSADVYYLYGVTGPGMERLWRQVVRDAPGGARVVSLRFPVQSATPTAQDGRRGQYVVYLYQLPLHPSPRPGTGTPTRGR